MTLPTPLIPMPTLNPNATPFDQIFGLAHIDAQSSRKGGDVLQFHHRFTFAHVKLAALERYFEFEATAGGRATTVVVATVVVATVVVAMHQCLQHLLRHRPTRQDGVRPRKRTVSVNGSINREKKEKHKKTKRLTRTTLGGRTPLVPPATGSSNFDQTPLPLFRRRSTCVARPVGRMEEWKNGQRGKRQEARGGKRHHKKRII